MSTAIGNHAVLGPGFSGGRAWVWLTVLLILAFAGGIVLTAFNPLYFLGGVVVAVCSVLFVWGAVSYPLATLCFVVLIQVIVPVFIRLPLKIPPTLLLLTVFVAIAVAKRMLDPHPTRQYKYQHLMGAALLIFNGALLISLPSPHANFSSVLMFIKVAVIPTGMFFTLIAVARTPDRVKSILNTVTVGAVLSGILGLHEYFTLNNIVAQYFAPEVSIDEDFFLWFLNNAKDSEDGFATGSVYRVYSFFTQPLEFAAFMVMAIPFPILMFVTAKTWKPRIIYGLATLVILAGFVVAFSRGPTLALGVVILFMGIFERRLRPWLLAGAGAMFVAVLAFLPLILEKLSDRITNLENVTLRFSLWKNGLTIFSDNPLRGIGFGSYPNYHVQSIRENQIGPMYEYTWPHIERVTTVENNFITIAAETGLIGLACFAFLLGAGFYVFCKIHSRYRDHEIGVLALASIAGGLSYLLSGMTVSNFTLYTITVLFIGVYVACLTALCNQLPDDDGAAPGRAKVTSLRP